MAPPDKRTGPKDTTPQGRINVEASTTINEAKVTRGRDGAGEP